MRGTDISIDESNFKASSGKFDVVGNISAIEGGYISLNMDDNSKFIGSTELDSGYDSAIDLTLSGIGSRWEIDKDSSLSNLIIKDGAIITPYDHDVIGATSLTINGNVTNDNGIIDLSNPIHNRFSTFTIDGNYIGNDGLIKMDTVLNDDLSPTDKVIITGDTSGTTNVEINNIGGTGASTVEGIEIIKVNGNSDGIFNKAGRMVAGAYEYFIKRGDGIVSDARNWYLTSNDITPPDPGPNPPDPGPNPPDPGPNPPDPGPNPPDPGPNPPDPGPTPPDPVPNPPDPVPTPPSSLNPTYRPEVGSYLANSVAVSSMFLHGFHDRLGENQSIYRPHLGIKKYDIWTRSVGNYSTFKDNSGQLKTKTNDYAIQVGGNIIHHITKSENNFLLGVMGGFGFNNSTTHSNRLSFSSKGQVEGYSLGLYASFYNNKDESFGYYADTWLTYSWFDNEVNG